MVVCKTHKWHHSYAQLIVDYMPTVLVTHRNLHGVVHSFRRMQMGVCYLDVRHLTDHVMWKSFSDLDLAFEDFAGAGMSCLGKLADLLGIEMSDNKLHQVRSELNNMQATGLSMCQVTKLWPGHISSFDHFCKRNKCAFRSSSSEVFGRYLNFYGHDPSEDN